ncbi:hypothetical protein [Sinosporangium siamense]|nr:hypothetical protein [Sinosporangium siamense]
MDDPQPALLGLGTMGAVLGRLDDEGVVDLLVQNNGQNSVG